MAKPGKTGLSRIVHAFGYSLKGLSAAWKHEVAFRQEVVLILVALPLAVWLAETRYEFLWLLFSLVLMLLAELTNSAIEAVVDRIGSEHHELAGRAKDIGSSLVLVSICFMVFVWCLVLWP